jgi:hypothetical protein
MKVSFDGLRRNIARDFNQVAKEVDDLKEILSTNEISWLRNDLGVLRSSLGALMACYDSEQAPEDFNDLSEEIKLLEL